MWRRFLAELKGTFLPPEVQLARARIRWRKVDDQIFIELCNTGDPLETLEMLTGGAANVVSIGRGVYASLPTATARAFLLETSRRASRTTVTVHVVVTDAESHLGQAVIDTSRRLLRLAGLTTAEPGDRFEPKTFVHCFFDEENLRSEMARAGLLVSERRGFTFVLHANHHVPKAVFERPDPFLLELVRVIRIVRDVEAQRRQKTPAHGVSATRAQGIRTMARGPVGRARLQRAIGWVDAIHPGAPNCFRRVLLETALDADAARETLVFGLDLGLGLNREAAPAIGCVGHVAFQGREERTFDVTFEIGHLDEPSVPR